jgi:hypothetical protein
VAGRTTRDRLFESLFERSEGHVMDASMSERAGSSVIFLVGFNFSQFVLLPQKE